MEGTGGIFRNLAKLSKLKNTKEVPGKGSHLQKTTEYGKIKCLAVKEHVRNTVSQKALQDSKQAEVQNKNYYSGGRRKENPRDFDTKLADNSVFSRGEAKVLEKISHLLVS